MSHEAQIVTAPPGEFVVVAHRLASVEVFEVMSNDLDALQRDIGDESQALGFFTAALGAFVPLAISLATLPSGATAASVGLYAATSAVSGLGALWFGIAWWRKRGAAKRFVEVLKNHRAPVSRAYMVAQRN